MARVLEWVRPLNSIPEFPCHNHPTMAQTRRYVAPHLTEYGDIATLTGFSGSTTEQDVIFTPNGNVVLSGPASEFACQIQNPSSTQCLPGTTR